MTATQQAEILQSAEGVAGSMPAIKVRIDRLRRHFSRGHEAHAELMELHPAFAEVLAGINEITSTVQALEVRVAVPAVPRAVRAEELELHPVRRDPDRRRLAANDRDEEPRP